jgi:RNA 2',3'-cyclic 3'-phosphodiesterase
MDPITEAVSRFPRRLFVGIRLGPGTAGLMVSVADCLLAKDFRGRYIGPDDLHATVAFLGNVPEPKIGDLVDILERQAAIVRPFGLRFDRLGGFPKREPRVVWLGSTRINTDFQRLGTALRREYADAGFTFPDALRLHVTLCRPQPRGRVPKIAFDPIETIAKTISLMESTRAEPRYRTIHEATLGG